MVPGLMLLLLSALSALAADRHTLATRAPDSAKSQRIGHLQVTNMQLSIGLPLQNKQEALDLFHQVYDAHSANYHRYLSPEQFAEKFGPTEQDYQKVINYAKASGLTIVRTFTNRALVDVAGSVTAVEDMFHVTMGAYQHPTENRQFFAPDGEPSVDASIPIMFADGLDNFVTLRHNGHRVRRDKRSGPIPNGGSDPVNGLYMGSDFRHAYLPGTTLTGAGQVVGVFEPQGYTPGDIVDYENFAGLPHVLVTNVLETLALDTSTNSGNDEVASDIELAIAMAPGLVQVSVYEGSDTSIITGMAEPSKAGAPRPNQLSASWGFEGDTNVEQGLIQLGLQGQSFMYAIGDGGAYANGVNTGTEQDLLYMTAVGGTQLFMNGAGVSYSNEVVWNDGGPPTNKAYFAGTGGVLSQVPIPYYQQGVSMALNHGSTQHRNVPDVALVSRGILIYFTGTPSNGVTQPGQPSGWVGTSAAAPLWAGYVALINQQAASQGQPPVGFLNPALYQVGEGSTYLSCFHNITNGNNAWTNAVSHTGTDNLYVATPGYNLCDGWGTPAGASLVDALIGYSGPTFVNFNYSGTQTGSYAQPFNTLAGGINAVATGGTIFIETAGSSSEKPTITKPMTIVANHGPATIGN